MLTLCLVFMVCRQAEQKEICHWWFFFTIVPKKLDSTFGQCFLSFKVCLFHKSVVLISTFVSHTNLELNTISGHIFFYDTSLILPFEDAVAETLLAVTSVLFEAILAAEDLLW